ncbi:hypothetical protein N7507_010007 [Penicillium longicatenatum]|nr:hypothetical protein N7507_010007 [Penicillium longicatenatum]
MEGDKRAVIYAVSGVFTGLELFAVILRIVARRLGQVNWNNDNWFIYLGVFWTLALNIVVIMYTRFGGAGLHEAFVEQTQPQMLIFFEKAIPPLAISWVLASTFPKLAVLQLYVKVFAIKREARITCFVTGLILVGNCVGTIIAALCVCIPLKALWDPSVSGKCININQFYRWARLANVLSDVVVLALPIPHILSLHATKKTKLGLMITFLFGGIGFVAALVTWVEYFKTNAVSDATWAAATILPWSVVEVDISSRFFSTGTASSEGNSWAKTDPQSTVRSNTEDDWVQLIHKKGQNGGTVTEGLKSTIRVEHQLTVQSDVRNQWDSKIV